MGAAAAVFASAGALSRNGEALEAQVATFPRDVRAARGAVCVRRRGACCGRPRDGVAMVRQAVERDRNDRLVVTLAWPGARR